MTDVPRIHDYIISIDGEWVCVCGNTALEEGFFPCDEYGVPVEPTPQEWDTDCYVCEQCGAIIDVHTLQIVGVRSVSQLP
jgi:hypothetical protein